MTNDDSIYERFLVEEYKALRTQIDNHMKDLLNLEKWALTVAGIFWSWFATVGPKNPPGLIYWCPAIMSFLFGMRALGLHVMNLQVGKYIRLVENRLSVSKPDGWENFLCSERPRIVMVSAVAFWILLLLFNVLIPLLYIPYVKGISR